ncbi:hypothetical protein AB1L42_14775 [Thalassoglobus sp. JC818]|uniref:hypothetical protein n=1 Tax=Thalassoglobus sp. JC818 TaxID=3232136 RepID=UPI003457F393
MKTCFSFAFAFATVVALNCASSQAAFDVISLPGTTQHDGWNGLTAANNPGYGGFPGAGPWPGPIGSNTTESGDAGLMKTANGTGGGPYPSGGSIYFGGFSADVNNNGGSLAVTDSTPVAGLQHIVFQIEIGEAYGFDFFNDALPTLSYNFAGGGGASAVAAGLSELVDQVQNGTFFDPVTGQDEPVYVNSYKLQWDLSGVVGTISDFSIDFTGVQHAQLYALQLDQSDTIGSSPNPVPEPSSLAIMLGLAGSGYPVFRRARRKVAC